MPRSKRSTGGDAARAPRAGWRSLLGRRAAGAGTAAPAPGEAAGAPAGAAASAADAPVEIVLPAQTTAPAVESPAASCEVDAGPNWAYLPTIDSGLDLTGVERRRARQATRKALDWHGRFVIAHLGTMGLKQGLEDLAPALRHLVGVQPDVLVSFIGTGSQRPALVRATAGLANVEIRDPVPSEQYLAVLLAADLLLVSERGVGSDIVVPGKLTTHFCSGRPVLAVVRPESATAAEVLRSGAGVVVPPDDPLGFTAQVALLRGDPDSRTRLGDAGMRYADQLLSRQGA